MNVREKQMAEKDLYAVLELPPGAPAADVKAAYRKLARLWHPDKNPADTKVSGEKIHTVTGLGLTQLWKIRAMSPQPATRTGTTTNTTVGGLCGLASRETGRVYHLVD